MATPLRALLLEDRPADAELIVAELRRQGHELEWTRVETEADFAAQLEQPYDVIFSDFSLPGFDALAALARVRRLGLSTPFIVVTGAVDEETAAECMREGASDYLLKGHLARLGTAVSQAVERRRLEDQRRQIEGALIASQAELSTVFDSAPVAMMILDRERRVVRANRASAQLAARPVAEIFGRLPGEAFGCANAAEGPAGCGSGSLCGGCPLGTLVTQTLEGRVAHHGVECSLPFGGRSGKDLLTYLVASSPIETAMGTLAVVSLEDITRRKQAEERERTLNRLLATIREINQLIVRERNRDWLLAESCRIAVEQGGLRMAWVGEADRETGEVRPLAAAGAEDGYLAEIGVRCDASPLGCDPIGTAIREGRPVVVDDLAAETSRGQWARTALERGFASMLAVPLVVNGRRFGIFAVFADQPREFGEEVAGLLVELAEDLGFAVGALETAARREAAEEALQESEERYRSFFEEDLTADFITGLDGTLVECNPAYLRILGFADRDEATAHPFTCLFPNSDDSRKLIELVLGRGRLENHVLELRRRDGTPLHVIANFGLVRDTQGRPARLKGYLFDVTERRNLEQQLRHAQKMEALGRLAGGVAHDFNNLLQAMLATLECLQPGRPDAGNAVEELTEQVRRGAGLARQLLLFARRGVTRSEALDLNQVLTTSTSLLQRVLPANVAINLEQVEQLLPVEADRGQLEQVLTNLVLNAGDAMPEGGTLTLRSWGDAEWVGLEVADTGEGMSWEVSRRIFEPFFTTKGERGTGLGLAVVHGIVSQHGGTISVDSAPGAGARFRVALPRCELRTPDPATQPTATEALQRGRNERILVVEDNEQIRVLFDKMLAKLGYRTTTVGSGEEALAEPVDGGYDLLISDVMLPGITGADLALALGERWPDLRVILMSGYAEDDVLRRTVSAGGVRFLQKPVSMVALAREVRAALDAEVGGPPA